METKFKPCDRNFYFIVPSNYCSLVMSEKMMRKVIKKITELNAYIRDLFDNNPDDFYSYDWSLAHPNDKQTTFYTISPETSLDKKLHRLNLGKAQIRKAEPLFEIASEASAYSKELVNCVTEYLET